MNRLLFIFVFFLLISSFLISKEIVIIHTNDIRNVLQPREATFINPDFPPVLGGIHSLSTAVKMEKDKALKKGSIFLLFDSGNFVYKNINNDSVDFVKPSIYFNHMGYDVVNIGLDEIVAGPEYLKGASDLFKPVLLSSNLSIVDSDFQPVKFHIIEKEGIRIGVFGLLTEFALLNLSDEILEKYVIQKEIETASMMVELLKNNRCSIIIALTSIGLEHDKILAETVKGIDIILGGFDGAGLRENIETPKNHTIIMKGYGELSSFDRIILNVDDYGKIVNYSVNSVTLFEERFSEDLKLKEILK